jgi:hypothetical protein
MAEKLMCPICAHDMAFTLIPHLRSEHGIEPEAFRARFPEQPLCTDDFTEFLRDHEVRRVNDVLHYQLDVAGTRMTARYDVDHGLTQIHPAARSDVCVDRPRARCG